MKLMIIGITAFALSSGLLHLNQGDPEESEGTPLSTRISAGITGQLDEWEHAVYRALNQWERDMWAGAGYSPTGAW